MSDSKKSIVCGSLESVAWLLLCSQEYEILMDCWNAIKEADAVERELSPVEMHELYCSTEVMTYYQFRQRVISELRGIGVNVS